MAGTVITHWVSLALYPSSPVLSRKTSIARSLRYRIECENTIRASTLLPFLAVNLVFRSKVWYETKIKNGWSDINQYITFYWFMRVRHFLLVILVENLAFKNKLMINLVVAYWSSQLGSFSLRTALQCFSRTLFFFRSPNNINIDINNNNNNNNNNNINKVYLYCKVTT